MIKFVLRHALLYQGRVMVRNTVVVHLDVDDVLMIGHDIILFIRKFIDGFNGLHLMLLLTSPSRGGNGSGTIVLGRSRLLID